MSDEPRALSDGSEEDIGRVVSGLVAMLEEDRAARDALRGRLDEPPSLLLDPDHGPCGFFFLLGERGLSMEVVLDFEQLRDLLHEYAERSERTPGIRFVTVVRLAQARERRRARRLARQLRDASPH
jgi:hypothetical protein